MYSNEDDFKPENHHDGHQQEDEPVLDDFAKYMIGNQAPQQEDHPVNNDHDDYAYKERNDRHDNYKEPPKQEYDDYPPPIKSQPPPQPVQKVNKAPGIQAKLQTQKSNYEEQQKSVTGTGMKRPTPGESDPQQSKGSLLNRLSTVVNPSRQEDINYDHLATLLKPGNGDLAGSLVQHDPSQSAVHRMHVVQGGQQKLPTLAREEHVIRQDIQKDSDDESVSQPSQRSPQMPPNNRQNQPPPVEEHKVNRMQLKEETYISQAPDAVSISSTPRNAHEIPIADAPAESARLRGAGSRAGEVKMTDFNDMSEEEIKNFLINPVPFGTLIQGTITRKKAGLFNMYPYFVLNFTETGQFICSGRKRSGNKTSNYLIACKDGDIDKNSPHTMGKVRSNFMGTAFHVYDNGANPDQSSKLPLEAIRCEKALVLYESNMLKSKTPRKMKVYLPLVNGAKDEAIIWRPLSERDGMLGSVENGIFEGMSYFVNKEPKWNSKLGAFTLDFQGRVKKPSVKNFQLVDPNYEDDVCMQFGKVTETTFNLDVRWPFSILQAFGVCMSSFDHKFACE